MTSMMHRVKAELGEMIGVLQDIPEADWDRPSACDGFRVRDVAGHLALVRLPLNRRMVAILTKSTPRAVALGGEWSTEYADEHTAAELIGFLEERAANPRKGFLGRVDPAANMLSDHATHVQDVRIGLDRREAHDPEQGRAVLDATVRLWRPVTWGSRERARGLRLVSPDIDWSHGEGLEVSGPYDAMLLALGGRSAGLRFLEGPGLPTLIERMPEAA